MRYLIGFALALAAASPAWAEDWDFMLINETGKAVKKIEVSPTGAADWKERLAEEGVEQKPVPPKGRTTVRFDRPSAACRYDVRATFADDSSAVFSSANVCNNSYVTIRMVGDKPSITAQ